MTFYERDKELEAIRKIEADTKSSAKMAVITGRPRPNRFSAAIS